MINLPKQFEPKFSTHLIRLGKDNDGGYIVSKNAVNSTKKLYSFGLDDDWSFEKDFHEMNNSKIYVYDASVNFYYWIKL